MEDDFYTIARQVHEERVRDEYWERNSIDYKAKTVMTDFRIWCRINEKDCDDENIFKEYLKAENPEVNFWVRKRIAEVYWNYVYTFDYQKQKWNAVKTPKHIDNGEKIK